MSGKFLLKKKYLVDGNGIQMSKQSKEIECTGKGERETNRKYGIF